jgi:ubiquinone/menaquinone biosynthesis C-methylase UbiE
MAASNSTRQQIRQGWERTSAQYGRDRLQVFQRFAERLVALLDLRPGQWVLDVGTGSGPVALRAAERIGPQGHTIGVDCAWGMAFQARAAAAASDQRNLGAVQMDAEFLGFPQGSFDLVTCAFSLFQFPDMGRALAEMERVLKPGGQLGLSNWGPGFFTPVARMQRDLFRAYGLRPLLANPIAFELEQIQTLLEAAGFAAIELLQEQAELRFETPREVWDWNLAMGPLPVMLEEQLTPEQRRELERRYREMLAPLTTPEGIACTFHPLYALARKSST